MESLYNYREIALELLAEKIADELNLIMEYSCNFRADKDNLFKRVQDYLKRLDAEDLIYKLDKISNGQIVYIQIKIDDTSNYTQYDVKVSEVSSGSISTKTSFDEVWSVDNKSLIYKAVLSYDPSKSSTDNSSVITFKLPDNSEKSVRLCK